MDNSVIAIDFQQGLTDAWSSVAQFVPKAVAFIAILLVGWIIAKVVAKIVNAVLERVGFDKLVERGELRNMMSRSKYDASDIIAKIAYYAILLIALQIGFAVFGPNPVSALLTSIVAWLPRAVVAIVIVVIAAAIAHAVSDLISNVLGGLSYGKMLGRIAAVFIWGIGIIAALNQIGVATSVTTPILIAVLATIGGILVVGVGGGLVRPMEQRWSNWLGNLESEMPAMKGHAQAYQRGREDAARQGEQVAPSTAAEQGRQARVMPGTGYPEGEPGWGGETAR